ncbi:MAG: FAD-dependent oxidoreductase [Treponema sp.]|jgi:NADH dehydrogenase|nr:FAD-dependent oxidoreductase [Treponema sp.]
MAKNILILGGGYGGVAAAKRLAKCYKKNDDVTITLVDRHPFHTLMTELHEVAGYRVGPDSVRVPYAKIFGASKVKVQLDTITGIDFDKNQAKSATKVYPYDYLVLGAGAEPNYFGMADVKANSFALWSYDDAMKLRYHIEDTFEKAVAEQDRLKRQKMLTFVVAGSGFTGIEMAGELLEWRNAMCTKWLISPNEVRIYVVEALGTILPVLEEELRDKVAEYLKKHGVELLINTAIVGADPGVVKFKDGSSVETSTFIWTAGVDGNGFADSLDLAKGPFGRNLENTDPGKPPKRNRRGRVLVTDEMRSVDHANVFAVGDNIWFIENEKPLPQIVETAMQTGETAAHNIITDIDGGEARKFKLNYHGVMVSVGGRYAVSNAMGIKLSGFFAMAMKHIVNLHYLIGIAGLNQCWEYIKHEFLDNQTRRTFVWGLGSYRTRGYWLLPLRLWLGLMWVFEGINKIGEGWLAWSSGSKSTWMFSPGVVQAGVPAAADTAAAAVAAEVADLFASGGDDLFGAAEDLFSSGGGEDLFGEVSSVVTTAAADAVSAASTVVTTAADSAYKAVWDLTQPIFATNGNLATWVRTTFMDGLMAYIPFQGFQLMVVIVEICIGLALIGGFFTWWAAAASIIMCLVFTANGLFRWDQAWFIFAGFLMLGGAGRAFGLDNWVVPAFKKWWNGTKLARRHHWYLDGPSK